SWSNQSAQKRRSSPASSGALSYCLPFRCDRSHDLCSIPGTIKVSGPDSKCPQVRVPTPRQSRLRSWRKLRDPWASSFVAKIHSVSKRSRRSPKPTNPDPARLGSTALGLGEFAQLYSSVPRRTWGNFVWRRAYLLQLRRLYPDPRGLELVERV